MRILIEIRGGVFQGATVDGDCGPLDIFVADHDNIEADVDAKIEFGGEGVDYERVTPEKFNEIMAEISGDEVVRM